MKKHIRVDTEDGFILSEEERKDCQKWCNELLIEGIILVAGDVICVNERDDTADWWFCRVATRTFGKTWDNKIQISYFVKGLE